MTEFRLTQISDTHLARRHQKLTDNFHRLSEHIDAKRPDLVVNSGDLAFDAPTNGDDLEFAKTLHNSLPVSCRYLPGNHDIGEDRWQFEAAGWYFIGLNSLIMNTGLASEAEQFDWLASQLAVSFGKPVALFLHKPLFLNSPDDPELPETSIRYVPMPARRRLVEMFGAVDLRLIASGHVHQRRDFTYAHVRHVWAPSAGFIIADARQEVIGVKEVGLVEYRFQPDSFEVVHLRAPGQTDVDLDSLIGMSSKT